MQWVLAGVAAALLGCSFSGGASPPGDGDGDGDGDRDGAPVDGIDPDITCPDEPDLIACYPFDLDIGDARGGHDALVESGQTAFVAGADGTALGIQSQSRIPVNNSGDFATDSFTVELWLGPGFQSGFVFDYDKRFSVRIYDPSIVRCLVEVSSKQSASATVDDTRWNHIACVFDPTQGLRIFVDQVEVELNAVTQSLAAPTGNQAHVGSDSPGGGSAFLGAVDNLRVWGRALAAGELCAECASIGDPNAP